MNVENGSEVAVQLRVVSLCSKTLVLIGGKVITGAARAER